MGRTPILVAVLVSFLFITAPLCAQLCPKQLPAGPDIQSTEVTLEGKLIYHNGIRQWFELKPGAPVCDQTSIQLVRGSKSWTLLETLRGCSVQSRGVLGDSGTGYYSRDLYQDVTSIRPKGSCARRKPFTTFGHARPQRGVNAYRVEMYVNYRPGDHPIQFVVTSSGRRLSPWQAYASYDLTGGYVLYGHCGKGFVAKSVFGTPEAKPDLIEWPTYDPESAAAAGKRDLVLGFTCVRGHEDF